MDAVAEFSVEAVGVEQGEEKLEVLLLAIVRRGRHQQQVTGAGTEFFREEKAPGLLKLGSEEMGGELVGFIENHEIPRGREKLFLKLLVACHLIEPDNEVIEILEGISGGRRGLKSGGEDIELKPEFFEKFVAPLLDQAARSDHENAPGIGPHDKFTDVEARHDGFSRSRIVS